MQDFDLELQKAVNYIKEHDPKIVCIQLPDRLKNDAKKIQETIEENTRSKVIIWFGSCFGACDIPQIKEADLLIQWGHSEWKH